MASPCQIDVSRVNGVTHRRLADDVIVEYTRGLTPKAFLTLGGSLSKPADDIRTTASAVLGSASPCSSAFANVVVSW